LSDFACVTGVKIKLNLHTLGGASIKSNGNERTRKKRVLFIKRGKLNTIVFPFFTFVVPGQVSSSVNIKNNIFVAHKACAVKKNDSPHLWRMCVMREYAYLLVKGRHEYAPIVYSKSTTGKREMQYCVQFCTRVNTQDLFFVSPVEYTLYICIYVSPLLGNVICICITLAAEMY